MLECGDGTRQCYKPLVLDDLGDSVLKNRIRYVFIINPKRQHIKFNTMVVFKQLLLDKFQHVCN